MNRGHRDYVLLKVNPIVDRYTNGEMFTARGVYDSIRKDTEGVPGVTTSEILEALNYLQSQGIVKRNGYIERAGSSRRAIKWVKL